jgi:hypothetical protein
VQFKMSTAPGQITSSLLKQAFQRWSSDKNQVGQPERANLERPSGDVKFEFPARPRSSADHAQAPAVMKLQRVAVADRQPGASLELQCLGPTSAVDAHPVVGLSLRVSPFRLVPGRLVLRNETLSVTEAPCCLSGRARSLDNHDHVAMIVHIESNPECRSVYRSLTGYLQTCRTPADATVPGQADTPSGHDVGLRGLDGFQGQGRVGESTSGSHLCGDPDRLHDLLRSIALSDGQLGVALDAVWALGHVRDGYRDQLLGLLGQRAVGEDGLAEALESVMDAGRQLLATLGLCGGGGWYRDSLIGFSFSRQAPFGGQCSGLRRGKPADPHPPDLRSLLEVVPGELAGVLRRELVVQRLGVVVVD